MAYSRPARSAGPDVVRQQTQLSLTSLPYVGARRGLAHYTLRQWGDFVDADRRIAFTGDLRSAGRGAVRYLSADAEVLFTAAVTLAGTTRRQAGRVPMNDDYATFDRIDLGGTQLALDVRPGAGRR